MKLAVPSIRMTHLGAFIASQGATGEAFSRFPVLQEGFFPRIGAWHGDPGVKTKGLLSNGLVHPKPKLHLLGSFDTSTLKKRLNLSN